MITIMRLNSEESFPFNIEVINQLIQFVKRDINALFGLVLDIQ